MWKAIAPGFRLGLNHGNAHNRRIKIELMEMVVTRQFRIYIDLPLDY